METLADIHRDVRSSAMATAARSHTLVTDAHAQIHALAGQLAHTRRLLEDAKALLARAAMICADPFDPMTTPPAAVQPARTFPAVNKLIEHVERTTRQDVGLAADLTADIRHAIFGGTDTALLIAILLESVAQTVLNRVPQPEHQEMTVALCTVLCNRISEHGSRPD